MGFFSRFRSQKFLSMLSSFTGAAMGLLTFALLARTLDQAQFGVFSFFLAATTLAEMIRNGLVGKPLIKYGAEAADSNTRRCVTGSSYMLGWKSSWIIGIAGSALFGIIYWWSPSEEFLLYSVFFLPLNLVSLPHNMATWVLNARLRFDKMIWIRTTLQSVYIAGVALAYWLGYDLWFIFSVYLLANILPSLVAMFFGWDGLRNLRKRNAHMYRQIYRYGRYTMMTLIGGNLLRSSDVFIIRSFLGPQAVALYQVPLRLVNLIDIPLRALVSFAFPSLAADHKRRSENFQHLFERSAGFAFLCLFPLALGAFLFAEPLVVLLGGVEYAEAAPIMRFFAIFMAITSVDRFGGVALDILNRPQINMQKVFVMLIINVIGDVLAVWLTGEVKWVALVSVFTFSGGIAFGFYRLRSILSFRPQIWLSEGLAEVRRIVKKLVSK